MLTSWRGGVKKDATLTLVSNFDSIIGVTCYLNEKLRKAVWFGLICFADFYGGEKG